MNRREAPVAEREMRHLLERATPRAAGRVASVALLLVLLALAGVALRASNDPDVRIVALVVSVLGVALLGILWAVLHVYQRRYDAWNRREAEYEAERKGFEAHAAHQAFHDPLTLLPNRALFMDRLAHALARADRQATGVAVLLLDLDRFKVINDSLDHAAGDQLLRAVAQRLRACTRPVDTTARVGGDEFTILLENVLDVSDAVHVAERIVERLRAPFRLGEHEVFMTTSIGIVLGIGEQHSATDLMRDVDAALYRAKARGRARYELFERSMNERALEQLRLEGDLRRGLERDEFQVYYQPTVDLLTGRIEALEALVRWAHPKRGILLPDEFIAVAEETGLIRTLGGWVLEEACRQTRAWQTEYPSATPRLISVNLSAQQFQQPELVEQITAVLQRTGLDPCLLQLEITESVVMDDAASTLVTLRALKDLGVHLAIDDFGTGYSSLSYLKRFPVDNIKVDKLFVQGVERDSGNNAIMQAVVTLAHALGMQVTAEGIESVAQLAQLQAIDCQLGQGYLFAKPLPKDMIGPLLAEESRGLPAIDTNLRPKGSAAGSQGAGVRGFETVP